MLPPKLLTITCVWLACFEVYRHAQGVDYVVMPYIVTVDHKGVHL